MYIHKHLYIYIHTYIHTHRWPLTTFSLSLRCLFFLLLPTATTALHVLAVVVAFNNFFLRGEWPCLVRVFSPNTHTRNATILIVLLFSLCILSRTVTLLTRKHIHAHYASLCSLALCLLCFYRPVLLAVIAGLRLLLLLPLPQSYVKDALIASHLLCANFSN